MYIQASAPVCSHVRFKRIPTHLCDLPMSHANGSVDLWMEDEPVTSIAQRFAVRGNDRHTCALMRPAVRGSHACFLIQNNQWLRRPRDSRAIFRRSADLGLPGKNLYRRLSERVYGCDCGVAPGVTSVDCFNSNEMKIASTLTWPRWSRFRIPSTTIAALRG